MEPSGRSVGYIEGGPARFTLWRWKLNERGKKLDREAANTSLKPRLLLVLCVSDFLGEAIPPSLSLPPSLPPSAVPCVPGFHDGRLFFPFARPLVHL